jgi:hypothetical protein
MEKFEMSNPNEKLLTISLQDYLALSGKKGEDFTLVGVEHTMYERVGSGESLWSIEHLENRAREEFLKRLPPRTVIVLSIQKCMGTNPSGFFSEGRQFVSYSGTALVTRTK